MSTLEEEHAKAEALIDSPALSVNTLKVLLHILGPAIIIGLFSTHCSGAFAQAVPTKNPIHDSIFTLGTMPAQEMRVD